MTATSQTALTTRIQGVGVAGYKENTGPGISQLLHDMRDSTVATVNSVADLRTALAAGVAPATYHVRYHTTLGDGGGGTFNVVAIGSYVDDDRNVFAGGSLAAIRTSEPAITLVPSGTALHFYQGAWYSDVGHTVEAVDDAARVRAAKDRLSAIGGGVLRLSAGNWYFKTFEPTASFREMVFPASNVTICGEGPATAIRIAPGLNTVAAGGYNVFALLYATANTEISGFHVTDLLIDCNSDYNQYPSNWASVLAHYNSAVRVDRAVNCSAERVTVINHNGQSAISFGTFGAIEWSSNVKVLGCTLKHLSDDANVTNPLTSGDQSWISIGAISYEVAGNHIDSTTGQARAIYTSTAIEVHGLTGSVHDNVVKGAAKFCNLAADSGAVSNSSISDNIATDVATGCTLWVSGSYAMTDTTIRGNNFSIIGSPNPNIIPCGTNIAVVSATTASGGFRHTSIIDNDIAYTDPTPTTGSIGIQLGDLCWSCEISSNRIRGFDNSGIQIGAATHAANAEVPNMVEDLLIADNTLTNCGMHPIFIYGQEGENADVLVRPTFVNNKFRDTGDPALIAYGFYLAVRTTGAIFSGNIVPTGVAEYLLLPGYGSSDPRYLDLTIKSARCLVNIQTIGPQIYAIQAQNTYSVATDGACGSPSFLMTGTASRLSDHTAQQCDAAWWHQPFGFSTSAVPSVVLSTQVALGGWEETLRISSYPAAVTLGAAKGLMLLPTSLGFRGQSPVAAPVISGADDSAKITSIINALTTQGLATV